MEVRIHTGIVEKGGVAAKLWYYAAALNPQGARKVVVDLSGASTFLGVSLRTLQRWMKNSTFFYPWSRKDGDELLLYPRARFKVCWDLGLDSWGVAAIVPLECLNDLKVTSTHAVALANQRSSKYAIKRGMVKKHGKRAKYLMSFIEPTIEPSPNSRGLIHQSKGNKFLDGTKRTPWGGSQKSIASDLQRSERTIRKRLRATPRFQQWYHIPRYNALYREGLFLQGEGVPTAMGIMYKFGEGEAGKVYKRHTLLYVDDLLLQTMGRSRSKFKSWLKLYETEA